LKKQNNHRKQPFQFSTILMTLAIIGAVLLTIGVLLPKKIVPQNLGPDETEAYILGKASPTNVSDRYTPVLLYTVVSPEKIYFLASGTFVHGKSGDEVITADHVFGKNEFHGDTAIGVKILQPMNKDITMVLSSVTVKAYCGRDIAVASTEDASYTPPTIHRYSQVAGTSTNLPGICTGATLSSGRRITKLQSLLTGKWYDIVGTTMEDRLPGVPVSLYLNYEASHGESGEGFQDEEGSLYVAPTVEAQIQPAWDLRKKEINTQYKKNVDGVIIVYGPLKIELK
jgi:hypothetical protein